MIVAAAAAAAAAVVAAAVVVVVVVVAAVAPLPKLERVDDVFAIHERTFLERFEKWGSRERPCGASRLTLTRSRQRASCNRICWGMGFAGSHKPRSSEEEGAPGTSAKIGRPPFRRSSLRHLRGRSFRGLRLG